MIRRILLVVLPLALLGLGALATMAIVNSREEPERIVREVPPPLVEVMELKASAVQLTVIAEGTVAPRTVTELVPEVPGRVLEVSPSLVVGGFFKKGDVLLQIDPREYELAIIRGRAAIEQARLRVAIERREGQLAAQEWETLGTGEPTDLALRKPYIAEAEAGLASAEADLARAEYDLERCVIRAPFDGRVRQEKVDVGQYVSRGAAVATLYSTDAAEIRLPIPDDQIAYIDLPLVYSDEEASMADRTGPRVTIRSEFGGKVHEWQAQIVRTEGEIDVRTRMIYAIARVEQPYARGQHSDRPPLAVGMYVEAEIQGRNSGAVFDLPRSVIRGEDIVMVLDEEDRLHFRQVEIMRQEGERVLVRSGLHSGERICISAIETPVEGMKVTVAGESPKVERPAPSGQRGSRPKKRERPTLAWNGGDSNRTTRALFSSPGVGA